MLLQNIQILQKKIQKHNTVNLFATLVLSLGKVNHILRLEFAVQVTKEVLQKIIYQLLYALTDFVKMKFLILSEKNIYQVGKKQNGFLKLQLELVVMLIMQRLKEMKITQFKISFAQSFKQVVRQALLGKPFQILKKTESLNQILTLTVLTGQMNL